MFHKSKNLTHLVVIVTIPILLFSSILVFHLYRPPQAQAVVVENTNSHDSPILSMPAEVLLVPTGAIWRYLDDGSDQDIAWRGLTFDDAAWSSGSAQLGYGDGDEATLVNYGPDPANKHITTYFRHSFYVADPTIYNDLSLNVLRDDGAIVYLNGTELFRTNMPTGTITHTTLASTNVGAADEITYFSANLDPNNLITGTNVIAVELHQITGNSSDLSFDLELIGLTDACNPVTVGFAVIGDYGFDNQPELDVSDLVKSWDPDFIITVGDNNYPAGEAETIDTNIGQYYHEFIGNYIGSYGPGAASNNFYPALGNHDWVTRSGNPPLPQPYLGYFSLPGNERYYNFRHGPVEFFAIDSDPNEPDGRSGSSTQAAWLQDQLAASNAPWKLVYMHHPPYSSSTVHGSEPEMQWPYQSWGATAVLAGHDHTYERLIQEGLPYFVNGLGGRSLYSFNNQPLASSVVRYRDDYGAMWVEANDSCITFQFISRAGAIIDTYAIKKEPPLSFLPSIFLPVILK